MNDNHRFGRTTRDKSNGINELVSPSNDVDMFFQSESPRAQQIRLIQKLREEIEGNSTNRVRYVDSELHLRNQPSNDSSQDPNNFTQSSGIQATATNYATAYHINASQAIDKSHAMAANSPSANNQVTNRSKQQVGQLADKDVKRNPMNADLNANSLMSVDNDRGEIEKGAHQDPTSSKRISADNKGTIGAGKGCQGCLIREVREDLMSVTKLIQERNEQLTKLKAHRLRSFFERQM